MENRVRRVWITFFVAIIAFVYGVHRWMELRIIDVAKNRDGGEALLKQYFDGSLGFMDFYQQVGQLNANKEVKKELPHEN